ncbi:hypothetical protein, partial [Enterobacter hormaechei]|uniref:hypothetical protein n=1 Tax=Enterobacter hormaechei TaxID=158836 RepID=UPI001C3ECD8E
WKAPRKIKYKPPGLAAVSGILRAYRHYPYEAFLIRVNGSKMQLFGFIEQLPARQPSENLK